MSLYIDDHALKTAASDMMKLKQRNQRLKGKLEAMYRNLTTALDTPAGYAVEWTGKDVLLEPIDDMNKVLEHMSDTLNILIGQGSEQKGTYYDKLFDEYNELDRILRNKSTN